jgi:hypothetical protein
MGTFGNQVFGGGGTGSAGGDAGVPLGTGIIDPMLRIAGITTLPGTIPNVDQRGEIIPMVNRLLGSWNCDGHKVYSTAISAPFPLTDGQKIYTIGPGGDIDMARPLFIKGANVLFPTTPVLRRPLAILDDDEWQMVAIQDITGAPPFELYYDGGFNESGLANIYLRFQPTAGYSLELYTWQALQTGFTTASDVAIFPPGYERALILNGALEVAEMNPLEAHISPTVAGRAALALQTLMVLNMSAPRIGTEAGLGADDDFEPRPWLSGGFR